MATDARETKHDKRLEVTVSKGPESRRQGKFQPFKRLFGRKKKRQAEKGFHAAELKASFSTGEVCNGVVSDDEETNQNLRETNPIGSRALSHDSIFIPEDPVTETSPDQNMSQENVSDKVRNLQRQIAQGIKFGQKPSSLRKSEGDEGSSDEEEVPRSPLKVLAQVEAEPAETEPKVQGAQQAGTHSTPVKSPRSKRVFPTTGTIESINLDAFPQSVPRLDNTAAKHKLSVKPKNQRICRKHRRFTQDLEEETLHGLLQGDLEAAAAVSTEEAQHRTAAEEPDYESLERSKKQKLQEEERRRESRRKREMEEQRLRQEEEERKRAEELRLRELEEERLRKQQEEERVRMEEEERRQREEVERRRRKEEEERRIREEEERRQREEEERRKREEEDKRRLEEQRRKEEEERKKREEEENRQRELEAERLHLEEKRLREEREEEERMRNLEAEKQRMHEMEERSKLEAEERKKKEEVEEEMKRLSWEEADRSSDPQERKRRAEELRWREMEERQSPFSFKVSSGEKQILFQKVNLTPVTPAASGHQGGAVADQREGTKAYSPETADSPSLPSSQCVPHTAILVTGAQLCGTADNMDQIKDTACKSLLGLGEDRKAMGTPPSKSKTSPDRNSGKTKSLNESSLSTDQSSAAVLAEWASIRSKIFKGAEDGKYEDYPDPTRNPTRPSSEDLNQPTFSHSNLRKTNSASAKFSITPAKKKFGDSNRSSELLSPEDKEEGSDTSSGSSAASPAPASKAQSKAGKTVRIADRGSEECMFAKDLPSFLVPSTGAKLEGAESKGRSPGETEDSDGREEEEDRGQDSEDTPSPFGIKLRRTNYSLRFHSEQSTEKRKKRYSAGDSFDGVPSPLTPIEPDSDASSVFSDKSSPTSPLKESAGGKLSHANASPAAPRAKAGKSPSAAMHSEGEKVLSKPPLYQRPPTSPKPTGAATTTTTPTPPPSPLPKVVRGGPGDAVAQRIGGAEPSSRERADRREESSAVVQLQRSSQGHVQGEEEPKEKRSFFPSINIPWREKADRKTELIRREKPSLQSRHSLDSARVQEKDKEAGPLWITLALQKQKGFREQQQSREDRRNQREAKLAEKQSREKEHATLVSPSNSKGSSSTSPCKPRTPEEPKRPDSLLGRFERRDHLKKANTLPSSVTVEIADSTPSPPAVKEVSKRFPSSDCPQVSTEPAWLALAKRKAKAWSDCPQIIK